MKNCTCGAQVADNAGHCQQCGKRFWPIIKGIVRLYVGCLLLIALFALVGSTHC